MRGRSELETSPRPHPQRDDHEHGHSNGEAVPDKTAQRVATQETQKEPHRTKPKDRRGDDSDEKWLAHAGGKSPVMDELRELIDGCASNHRDGKQKRVANRFLPFETKTAKGGQGYPGARYPRGESQGLGDAHHKGMPPAKRVEPFRQFGVRVHHPHDGPEGDK